MNLKTGILVVAMAAGTAAAQNANVIQKTRESMNAVQQKQASGSDAALHAINGQSAKPSAAAASAPAKTISIQAPAKAPAMKTTVAVPVAQAQEGGRESGSDRRAAKVCHRSRRRRQQGGRRSRHRRRKTKRTPRTIRTLPNRKNTR